eukprot:6214419-Pleurochrysis_carterae.AAC.3
MFASFPTSERACLQGTLPRSVASARASAIAASSSVRFPSGQRSLSSCTPTLLPSAVTGSPTTTFAGAADSPSSRSPMTASFACTHARDAARAGAPPPAAVCTGSISTASTLAGGSTSSSRAMPVKSSIYTWMYRGAVCSPPSFNWPDRCARSLRTCHARAAGGSGCTASKAACFRCTHAATSVEMRSNLFGA